MLIVFLYSCRKKEVEMGQMNIRLTDTPGDFQALNLDIRKVKIHSNRSHPEADWIELTTNSGVYDMIRLGNGMDTLLANGDLPTGTFNTLRIELGPNNSVQVNGGTFPLTIPGNKLEFDMGAIVKEDEEIHFLIDLDLRSSVVKDGSGNYIFYPGVRVADLSQSGSIKGAVDPATPNCKVHAISGFDTITTCAGSGGGFKIQGLKPGLYHVTAVPPAPTTPGTVPNVPVAAKVEKDIGVVQVGQ